MANIGRGVLKTLKWISIILGSLVGFVLLLVVAVWMFPEAILTNERVSGIVAPIFEFKPKDPDSNAPLIDLDIEKPSFFHRTLVVTLKPGCYGMTAEKDDSEYCIDAAKVGISFRLDKKTIVKLTALRELDVHLARGRLGPPPTPEKPPEEETSTGPTSILKYFDSEFSWGPTRLQIDRFEIPASKLVVVGKLSSEASEDRGVETRPTLVLDLSADSPEWGAKLAGTLVQTGPELTIPKSTVEYRTKTGSPIELKGVLSAKYHLKSGDADATITTQWKNPATGIGLVSTENAKFTKRSSGLNAKVPLKVLLHGETPIGRPPLLPVQIDVSMGMDPNVAEPPIEFRIGIDTYNFAGVEVNSDLEGTLRTGTPMGLDWKRGEFRVEIDDFRKTVKRLHRTSWAVIAPFNVFKGPIVLKTEPFTEDSERTTLPVVLTTELTSKEQAFQTETRAEIDIGKKKLGLLGIRVKALLRRIQLRLPDYDPLAPVPALARDSRIVRPDKKTIPATDPTPSRPVKKVTTVASPKAKPTAKADDGSFPITVEIASGPDAIVLLNRFFKPSFAAGINLKTEVGTEGGTLIGSIRQGRPFDIHYLNREITLERLDITMDPDVEIAARVSMKRGGYLIYADLNQRFGRTQIDLGSKPPLEESEIVSLLIYGMPRNSISSEQTRSVGSAQAAMGSEALGIFSFWAFASTPIESVLYDPETQTYSAVVKLPGGVVASVGSNWEDERQVALSKSLGRSWAVSTEIMQDAEGVERGGTLLRWRKSY